MLVFFAGRDQVRIQPDQQPVQRSTRQLPPSNDADFRRRLLSEHDPYLFLHEFSSRAAALCWLGDFTGPSSWTSIDMPNLESAYASSTDSSNQVTRSLEGHQTRRYWCAYRRDRKPRTNHDKRFGGVCLRTAVIIRFLRPISAPKWFSRWDAPVSTPAKAH